MLVRRSSLLGTALPTLVLFLLAFGPFARPAATPRPAPLPASALGRSGFLTGPQAGDPLALALDYLRNNTASLGLTRDDLADVQLTDRYVSAHTGVTHLYLEQRANGIPVHNGLITVSVMADGRILFVGNRFVPALSANVGAAPRPALSPVQAVERAAAHLRLTITQPLATLSRKGGAAHGEVLSDGGISRDAIPVGLVYDTSGIVPRLAWATVINQRDGRHWWHVRVDAATGAILSHNDWVHADQWGPDVQAGDATGGLAPGVAAVAAAPAPAGGDGSSYRGYALPVESPNHSTPAAPADGRMLLSSPSDPLASPFGWHDTDGAAGPEFTTTQGNNVHAYIDADEDQVPDPGSSPDGGAGLDFEFPLDLTLAPSAYRPAAVTNLFLWNNYMHDVSYRYGFTEAAGNFQVNSYGRGGLGNDAVLAATQISVAFNNAMFSSPPDGETPQMTLLLWNRTTPHRDGGFDNGLIAHEYGHGISSRLTGGPSRADCLWNAEQMGEGWSDWQALFMTQQASHTSTTPRGMFTYPRGEPITGRGARLFPYTTDLAVNPHTYASSQTVAVPHGVGSVWAAMLWELNWELIGRYGFDQDVVRPEGGPWTALSGNQLAQQLITDGMKLQPCSPGFVDGRDAILAADRAYTAGANQCAIWTAFAKRGLGASASQGSAESNDDNAEAFDLPAFCLTLGAVPAEQTICRGASALTHVGVGSGNTSPVTLSVTGVPALASASFSPNPVLAAPGVSTLTVVTTSGVAGGTYPLVIASTAPTATYTVPITLHVVPSVPAAPALQSPANGATGVSMDPTLSWGSVAGSTAYHLEIATDAAFATIVYATTTTATLDLSAATLADNMVHYWRVTASNVCGASAPSPVFSFTTRDLPGTCPLGATTAVSYSTDLEDGAPGWTHGGEGDSWVLSDAHTTSGTQAWHAAVPDTQTDQRLVSPPITIPPASQAPVTLRFNNRQRFENPLPDGRCWDGSIIEISTDAGATWDQIPQSALLHDRYDNIIWDDGIEPPINPLGPVEAWCDPGGPVSWVTGVVDLQAYAGQTAQFRWRLGTTFGGSSEGWFIDDIRVQSCSAPPHGIALSPDAAQAAVSGSTVAYPVTLTNTGTLSTTYRVTISGNGWPTSADAASVSLAAGAQQTLTVSVAIPAAAANGATDTATVTAAAQSTTAVSATTQLVTTAMRRQLYLPVIGRP